jgi:predicted DNA repair protein MutK
VGGGILTHGVPALHHAIEAVTQPLGPPLAALLPIAADVATGLAAGAVVLAVVAGVQRLRGGAA